MMPKYKVLDGINIQWPWSELLISGKKSVETRSYALPKRLYGVELAIIETPGKDGKSKAGIERARIIGTIVFDDCYQYRSKNHWLSERAKHRVQQDDRLYGFTADKEKWAWTVKKIEKLDLSAPPPRKRGIIFAKNCKVPTK